MAKTKEEPVVVQITISEGIRQIESVRWVIELYEHHWNDKGEIVKTVVLKTSDPNNWMRAVELWEKWSIKEFMKVNQNTFNSRTFKGDL